MYNHETTGSQNQQGFEPKNHGCGPFGKRFGHKFGGKSPWGKMFNASFANRKAANIEENDSSFIISLYAAGLNKNNFKISVTNDVLTIAYNAPNTSETRQSRYSHQEYEPGSFERSFQLNGKVLTDTISAAYTDGVMIVTLPKNPETNKPAQEVPVS